jgi:hypothetical protein
MYILAILMTMSTRSKQTRKAVPEKFMMRIDEEFLTALNELRTLYDDVPPKAEAIRRAVMTALEVERRERKSKAK